MIPKLRLGFPRPITALHQIELTSRCSLACVYCPNPHMKRRLPLFNADEPRPAMDMSAAHYALALDWARFFVERGTQVDLNLAGIGETMMREDFVECMEQARRVVGEKVVLLMATNGLHLTESIAADLKRLRVFIWVSQHRPEKAGLAVQLAKKYDILAGVSLDPALNADDWAGQVDWFRSLSTNPTCQWLREGKVIALSDGRVSACCLDASGKGTVATLTDDPRTVTTKPFSLCASCQYEIAVAGYEQRGGGG